MPNPITKRWRKPETDYIIELSNLWASWVNEHENKSFTVYPGSWQPLTGKESDCQADRAIWVRSRPELNMRESIQILFNRIIDDAVGELTFPEGYRRTRTCCLQFAVFDKCDMDPRLWGEDLEEGGVKL